MPYLAIKCLPKDEAFKKNAAEKLNQALLDIWGCPQEAITISIEEFTREEWAEKVRIPEIEPRMDKMMIVSGKKTDKML